MSGTPEQRRRTFGRNVRIRRIEMGFSQEVLGERANLHRTYVGSVERGERNLALDAIWQLADALEVDPGELIQKPVLPSETAARPA